MELKDIRRGVVPKPPSLNAQRSPYAPVTRAPVVPAATNMMRPVPFSTQTLTGKTLYNAQKTKDQNRVDESPVSGVTTQNKYNAFNETPAMKAARNSGFGYMYDALHPEDTKKFATSQQLSQNAVDAGADALAIGMGASAGGVHGAAGAAALNFGMKGIDFASHYFDAPALMNAVGLGALGVTGINLWAAANAFVRKDYVKAAQLAGPLAVEILKIGGSQALSDYIYKDTGVYTGDAIRNLADLYPSTNLMKHYNDYGRAFTNPGNFPLAWAQWRQQNPNANQQQIREYIQSVANNKAYNSQGNPLMYLPKILSDTLFGPQDFKKRIEKAQAFVKGAFSPEIGAFNWPQSLAGKNKSWNFYNVLAPLFNGFDERFAKASGAHEYSHMYDDFVNDLGWERAVNNAFFIPNPQNPSRDHRKYLSAPNEQRAEVFSLMNMLFNQGTQTHRQESDRQFKGRIAWTAAKNEFPKKYSSIKNQQGLWDILSKIYPLTH